MGLIASLFGSKEVRKGLMDTADVMWETTEEKSRAKMMFLKLYEPFKLAQRLAMLIILPPFVLIHIIVAVTWFALLWFPSTGELFDFRLMQLKELATMNNLTLGEPASWILAFYFLGGAGEGMIKAWSNKVSTRK